MIRLRHWHAYRLSSKTDPRAGLRGELRARVRARLSGESPAQRSPSPAAASPSWLRAAAQPQREGPQSVPACETAFRTGAGSSADHALQKSVRAQLLSGLRNLVQLPSTGQ